jgi:hypothetical protein
VIRRACAASFLVLVTALMWSDTVIEWWQSILEWFLAANESATQSLLDARPGNDMDLHVVVWAVSAWSMAWAFASRRWRVLVGVAVWSLVVEFLQPVFTDLRARQSLDYVGNLLGVGLVAVGFAAIGVVQRRRNQPSSPAM